MTIIIISVATNVLIASQPRQLIVLPKRKGVLDRRRLVWFDPTPGNHDLNIDIAFVYVEFKVKTFLCLTRYKEAMWKYDDKHSKLISCQKDLKIGRV